MNGTPIPSTPVTSPDANFYIALFNLVVTLALVAERMFQRVRKSQCCGGSVVLATTASQGALTDSGDKPKTS